MQRYQIAQELRRGIPDFKKYHLFYMPMNPRGVCILKDNKVIGLYLKSENTMTLIAGRD